MPVPNLNHPVLIVIQQIDKQRTHYDDQAREPIQKVISQPRDVRIQGQPKIQGSGRSLERAEFRAGGVQAESQGYVLFRYVDMQACKVEFAIGDRIVKIGHLDFDVYINRLQPVGVYSVTGGFSMLKAHFGARQPVRGKPGGD